MPINIAPAYNFRVKAYIIHGGDDGGDDDPSDALQSSDSLSIMFPENGWEDIRKASGFKFGMSQIVAYFVTRSVKAAGDLKSINKSAETLFICGHIQNI